MSQLAAGTAGPLIARDAELAEIVDALRSTSVVVSAAAGVGKSRLARAVVERQERGGWLTGWVQATRSAAAIPLGAFAGLLPDGVRSDEMAQLMRQSAEALLERAAGRPVVLGVDDAQLLDPVSAALVLHLVRQGVRVLATVRSGEPVPDAIAALTKEGDARGVELGPLADAAVAALVEADLGGPAEEAAVRWVAETAQGNPLYVHELVAGAQASGALAQSDGLWQLVGRPGVSASLRELIAARLEDLRAEQRGPVELLSVCEPLTVPELVTLTSYEALSDAEARGLVVMDSTERARLAHPLFGEVVADALPALRGRSLRHQLAETLRRRDPLTPDDALRIARLLLDAGAEIPRELRLEAAGAANLAGDPDLGAQLAESALEDGGLGAALLLARAHMLRNRDEDAEAVLAAVEPRAAGDPRAFEYLRQRTWNLTWGLHRADATIALIDRALGWSDDPAWAAHVGLLRRMETAIGEGFSAVAEIELALTDPALSADERTVLQVFASQTALFSGDGDTAAEIARRVRPSVPLRSLADTVALGASTLVTIETGLGWPDVEPYMADTFKAAVRAGDHEAAGAASLTLAALQFLRGRYRDAQRWFAEAHVHYAQHDTFGSLVHVHTFQAGLACATGDFDGATAALSRIDAVLGGRVPLPNQRPYVLRAQGWAAGLKSRAAAVDRFLTGAEELERTPIFAAQLVYEALRAGADAAPRLHGLAVRCRAPLVAAYAAHADGRARGDGAALLDAAEGFATLGAMRYAMEAATEASAAFLRAGRRDSARRAVARALELHQPDQGTEPPVVDGLEGAAVELTPREAQIAGLVRRGLSNPEIADRLVLSVRTVESHVQRAMVKRGVNDRREL
jgi:DNA-binding CsgD family transcriptional regulator/type II secretory pathway predicted ATPase ExeA